LRCLFADSDMPIVEFYGADHGGGRAGYGESCANTGRNVRNNSTVPAGAFRQRCKGCLNLMKLIGAITQHR
jgi:hypothetical protein